jgi:hypothetical protein
MEARTELRGIGLSKGLVVVIAVCVALALGITAGVVAKNFKAAPAPTQTHFVQGLGGPASEQPAKRGGTAIVSGSDYVPGLEYAIPSEMTAPAAPAKESSGLRNRRGFRD